MREGDDLFVVVGIAVVIGIVLFFTGMWIGDDAAWESAKDEAIEHKAAEWRCDAQTGKTEFVWLTD